MFWIVGRGTGAEWEPRWDYPPCDSETIAKAVAESLAKATASPHEARGPWVRSRETGPQEPAKAF